MTRINIDLLDLVPKNMSSGLDLAKWLATAKFQEQVAKHHLPKAWLKEAQLEIVRTEVTQLVFINEKTYLGYEMKFSACAETDSGNTFRRTLSLVVAPHNPEAELKSARVFL